MVRLGTNFELSENLYSLLFVSLIRSEYVDACKEEEPKVVSEHVTEEKVDIVSDIGLD